MEGFLRTVTQSGILRTVTQSGILRTVTQSDGRYFKDVTQSDGARQFSDAITCPTLSGRPESPSVGRRGPSVGFVRV